jgi:hypothetical protein
MDTSTQVLPKTDSPRIEVRRLVARRHFQFLTEWFLLMLLGGALWYALGAGGLGTMFEYPAGARYTIMIRAWERFGILAAVGTVLLTIIYYGTSYEVTPFRLFLPFLTKIAPFRILKKYETPPQSESSDNGQAEVTQRVTSEEIMDRVADEEMDEVSQDEAVETILRTSAHTSAKLAAKMERRINTHLYMGVLVGGLGLAVWWMSFYYGGGMSDKLDLQHFLMGTIPRITILLFIELLAGFFLRQYRIGVEDLKYFLELRRRADAKRVAYSIYDRLADTNSKLEFAKMLIQEKSDIRLAAGETTTTLDAISKEQNEIIKGLDVIGSKLEGVARAFRREK